MDEHAAPQTETAAERRSIMNHDDDVALDVLLEGASSVPLQQRPKIMAWAHQALASSVRDLSQDGSLHDSYYGNDALGWTYDARKKKGHGWGWGMGNGDGQGFHVSAGTGSGDNPDGLGTSPMIEAPLTESEEDRFFDYREDDAHLSALMR